MRLVYHATSIPQCLQYTMQLVYLWLQYTMQLVYLSGRIFTSLPVITAYHSTRLFQWTQYTMQLVLWQLVCHSGRSIPMPLVYLSGRSIPCNQFTSVVAVYHATPQGRSTFPRVELHFLFSNVCLWWAESLWSGQEQQGVGGQGGTGCCGRREGQRGRGGGGGRGFRALTSVCYSDFKFHFIHYFIFCFYYCLHCCQSQSSYQLKLLLKFYCLNFISCSPAIVPVNRSSKSRFFQAFVTDVLDICFQKKKKILESKIQWLKPQSWVACPSQRKIERNPKREKNSGGGGGYLSLTM